MAFVQSWCRRTRTRCCDDGPPHQRKTLNPQPNRVLAAEQGLPPVILFAFDDYFPAVSATDLLVRSDDFIS